MTNNLEGRMRRLWMPAALASVVMVGAACNSRGAGDADQGRTDERQTARVGTTDTTSAATGGTTTGGTTSAGASAAATTLGKMDAADNEEIQAGQLAQRNAKSNDVKRLGALLASDHQAHRKQIERIAKQANVTLAPPPSAAADQMRKMDQLGNLRGADFDRAFVQMQIDDHQKNITELQSARASADSNTQALIDQTVPKLQQHLKAAQAAQKKVGSGSSAGGAGAAKTGASDSAARQ
jgi:putative membrane protein